ncbi:MFS transporter [Nocardioides sediminis]|uniref:MFS transporter n=1 Tax=Nocardioides sediminis TaxID=433648 RepID=UPI000D322F11|nr:MFS transporter [Nocardioides sediminis]
MTAPLPCQSTPDLPVRDALRRRDQLVLAGLVLAIGLNLRLHLGTVPALMSQMESDLGLSKAGFGLVSSTCIVAMGLAAPLGPRMSARFGVDRAMTLMLFALTAGALLRLGAGTLPVLFVAVAITGAAMGSASSLIPGIVARAVPRHGGVVTGMYSSCMALGVGVAAVVSRPLATELGSWQRSLASWGILSGVTLLAWWLFAGDPANRLGVAEQRVAARPAAGLPWRSGTAWLVTLMVATPMTVGLAGLAWMDPLYQERGGSPAAAAALLFVFQGVQLFALIGIPALCQVVTDRRPVQAGCLAAILVGLVALAAPDRTLAVPAVVLIGLGVGGATSLGMVLIGDAAPTPLASAQLGGLAYLVAFVGGAGGPAALGALRQLTGSFVPGLAALMALCLLALCFVPRLPSGLDRVPSAPGATRRGRDRP